MAKEARLAGQGRVILASARYVSPASVAGLESYISITIL